MKAAFLTAAIGLAWFATAQPTEAQVYVRPRGTSVIVNTPYFSGYYGRGYPGYYGGYASYGTYGYGYAAPYYGYYRPYGYYAPYAYPGPYVGVPPAVYPYDTVRYYYENPALSEAPVRVTPETRAYYSGPPTSSDKARIRILVPSPDATVWFQGVKTQQTGTERVFESPTLEQGKQYTYQIQAAWMENGKEVKREQSVDIQPGGENIVNFRERGGPRPQPPGEELPKPRPIPGK